MQCCPTELPPERLSGLSPISQQTEAWPFRNSGPMCAVLSQLLSRLALEPCLPWDPSFFNPPVQSAMLAAHGSSALTCYDAW